MGDTYSMTKLLWSLDPATQRAIGIVLGLAMLSAVTIFIPLITRLVRLFLLERRIREWADDSASSAIAMRDAETVSSDRNLDREELRNLFAKSPIPAAYAEFDRRWTTALLTEGVDRAPIRLMDIFEERPLLPFGPRRSLLPVMPGLFMGIGVFAALAGLIPSLTSTATDTLSGEARAAWMATQLALAFRATAWGFICAIGATVSGRLIEGYFDARSHGLDRVVEDAFGSISPGELAEITRQTQQRSLDRLGSELTRFASELSERLDRGLQRIEQSTARSANLVSQEQRGALHTVVQELSLSVRQGVEHHLSELRGALQRAVEHQSSVTGGLAETFERMVENSNAQDRVARTLADSASSVEAAANAMRESASEMKPVLEHLNNTSLGLAETAKHIDSTQKVTARTAETVRSSLEHAAAAVDDQKNFIEVSLGEIRRSLVGLGDGLGDSLKRALREVDDALDGTVGQLRKTLAESNETIERLAGPIRAAEGTTRETHVALDRVRGEVDALGQWMRQAVKPLHSGLSDVGSRAEDIARTMVDFTHSTRQIDKTMEALREEIHAESRRLQETGSELSRCLKLASDNVNLFASTDPDSARRPRPDTAAYNGSQTPEVLGNENSDSLPSRIPGNTGANPPEETHATNAVGRDRAASDENTATGSAGQELASGYRIGAARAQGPDPYGRFDEDDPEPPSPTRHFPADDRKLGDNLKLSGLLGPSTRADSAPASVVSNSSGETLDQQSDGRGKAAQAPDDTE